MLPLTISSLCISTIWDFKTRKIPNVITIPSILLGLIVNAYLWGMEGVEKSIFGILLGVLLFLLPFALGGMGAGDVKLLAAVGAINGANFTFYTFLYGAIAGGLIALVILLLRGKLLGIFIHGFELLSNFTTAIAIGNRPVFRNSGIKFPYGIAILIGAVLTYILR